MGRRNKGGNVGRPVGARELPNRPGWTEFSGLAMPVPLYEALLAYYEREKARVQAEMPMGQVCRLSLGDVVRGLLARGVAA